MHKSCTYLKIKRRKAVNALTSHSYMPIEPLHSSSIPKEGTTISIDFREKRIAIVFKTIYVFAIFFAAIFIDMASRATNGIDITFSAEACFSAFFVVVMWYIVSYIFNEMKCMTAKASDKQANLTEESYSRIFSAFISGIIVALTCWYISYCCKDYFNLDILVRVFAISCGLTLTTYIFPNTNSRLFRVLSDYVGPGLMTLALSAFFLLIGHTVSA